MARGGARIVSGPVGDAILGAVDEATHRAALEIGARAASIVKESLLSDPDSRGHVGRFDTGTSHENVVAKAPTKTAGGWMVDVGIGPPRDVIAGVLEKGRRKGKAPPPTEALVPWVERNLSNRIAARLPGARITNNAARRQAKREAILARKGIKFRRTQGPKVSGVKAKTLANEVHRVAFLIARAIGRKGTPGLGMFEKAAKILNGGLARTILRDALRRTLRATGNAPRRGGRR